MARSRARIGREMARAMRVVSGGGLWVAEEEEELSVGRGMLLGVVGVVGVLDEDGEEDEGGVGEEMTVEMDRVGGKDEGGGCVVITVVIVVLWRNWSGMER